MGNARVNFRANGTMVTFLEEMHYYPFGMLMEGIGTTPVTVNKYKYNGKELNDDLGLNLSDYGARWYDPAVGRWWSVDNLVGTNPDCSPYVYSLNNPIKVVDIGGNYIIITSLDISTLERMNKILSNYFGSMVKFDYYRESEEFSKPRVIQNARLIITKTGALDDPSKEAVTLLDIFEKRWRKPIFVFAKDMIINASATSTQI